VSLPQQTWHSTCTTCRSHPCSSRPLYSTPLGCTSQRTSRKSRPNGPTMPQLTPLSQHPRYLTYGFPGAPACDPRWRCRLPPSAPRGIRTSSRHGGRRRRSRGLVDVELARRRRGHRHLGGGGARRNMCSHGSNGECRDDAGGNHCSPLVLRRGCPVSSAAACLWRERFG
jgi:hypothetical protein